MDRIRVSSSGRIDATVHTTGEVVPYYEEYKGVKEGILDVAYIPGYEWMPVLGPKTNLIGGSGFPGGPTPEQYMAHYYVGNGEALSNELWGDWGIAVGAQAVTTEIFAHSNVKLVNAADFKGIKFRTAGIWGDVLSKYYGTAVVNMPGGEVYQAAERGVIDAFEYCPPSTNWPMGFHEITKYLVLPGIHSPAGLQIFFVNEDSWNKLPDDLKQIVRGEIEAGGFDILVNAKYQDALAMQMYRDYGTEIVFLSDEFQRDICAKSREFHMQYYADDPMFQKIWDDMEAFVKVYKQAALVEPAYGVFD